MKKGYDVFGKAYGVMLRNDLHAPGSIDHRFMEEMILLDGESKAFLYGKAPEKTVMHKHELFPFAERFRGGSDHETICNVLAYTRAMAQAYEVPFEAMRFGGTEKQILDRGTDWCSDMARVGAVLLGCLGIPARIVHLVNPRKAYNGHVVVEAFYEGKYGVCDFIYGYCFHDGRPVDAAAMSENPGCLEGCPQDYRELYGAIAINEYDPMNPENKYAISTPNPYYLSLINSDHQGSWIMGEEG